MTIDNLSLSFGTQTIFDNITMHIPANAKVGVVGVNGAGKTTLFKLITGEVLPDDGSITYENNHRIELLPQVINDEIPSMNISVFDFLSSGRPIKKLEAEMQELYNKLAIVNETEHQKIFKRIDQIQNKLDYWDCYEAESILIKIIEGMNISLELLNKKLNELSGGQKSKIAFAKLLYSKPEILLLDEPTNHLDSDTKEYVINYLKSYKGTVFVISHDINFLNQVTDKTLFIDKRIHKMKLYNGNYDIFKKQNEAQEEALKRQAEIQQQEEDKLRAIINKYMTSSGKRKKMAQDREKKLEKLLKNKIEIAPNQKQINLDMALNRNSSNIPLRIKNLFFKYDKDSPHNIIENLNLDIYRGEKFLIVGQNGAGKSTLIKLINGILIPDKGNIEIGNKTDIGYYAQEHELLDNNKSILENFNDTNLTQKNLRSVLAKFLFYGDDVFKKVGVLSPGERSRVALAKLSVKGSNLLLLDEPTNHLDPETQTIIGETFKTFEGTMLVVSHNPDFVDTLGIERVLILPEGKISYYNRDIVEHFHECNVDDEHKKSRNLGR